MNARPTIVDRTPRRDGAEILSVGMVTPSGYSGAQTAAAVRTGIGRLAESYVTDRFGEPLVMGLADLEELPPLVEALDDRDLSTRHERLVRLGGPSILETLATWSDDPLPLLLGLPEARTETRHPIGGELIDLLSIQTGRTFDAAHSRAYPLGRAAAFAALDEALDLLARGRAPALLVGAVDSYLDLGLLEALDGEGRLRTGEISDGFIPGEAAAFLLLAPPGTADRRGLRPLARITGFARGHEPGHLYSEDPHRGDGLAAAFHALFDGGRVGDRRPSGVGCVYAGLNGESYWAKEWGVAQIRCADQLAPSLRVEHPADCIGDAGAALGPVMLGLAALDLARDSDGSRGSVDGSCLVWTGSDRGERAVVQLVR